MLVGASLKVGAGGRGLRTVLGCWDGASVLIDAQSPDSITKLGGQQLLPEALVGAAQVKSLDLLA